MCVCLSLSLSLCVCVCVCVRVRARASCVGPSRHRCETPSATGRVSSPEVAEYFSALSVLVVLRFLRGPGLQESGVCCFSEASSLRSF